MPAPDPTFETARMWLRPVAQADLDALVELDSDPAVMRYINGGQPQPREVYEAGLLERMLVHLGQPFGYFSAFAGGPEGPFIGWFHLRPSVFDEAVLELGYRLRQASWGRGLASEGSRALLHHGFEVLGCPAIDACAMPDNAASIAVIRKLGMSYVGMFEHPRAPGLEVARYLLGAAAYAERQPPAS